MKRKGPSLVQQAHLKHLLAEGYPSKQQHTPSSHLEIKTPLKFTSTLTFESSSPYAQRQLHDCGSPGLMR